ncbi:MAG: CDP-alcohol phosphatidyltransferase family protein [Bacteroidia bacterium]|nr:CDP-alcohol phosphatidyltransferase family protein [Bacteroidia bacterium]MDW8014931.1 CDP-alcohol phosphatidyltransferase family protein [Bacteroidia bacterium]
MWRHLLPNLLTLGNLALGSWAIALSYEREWVLFSGAMGGALLCDWLDGWVARALRSESPLGKELDALADLVSFGIAPAFALYNYLRPFLPALPYSREARFWMVITPFILPLLAAWRLARFNTESSETSLRFFQGLPTPAHAAAWTLWILSEPPLPWLHPALWIGLILLVGGLMVSSLPFLSLKTPQNIPWLFGLLLLIGTSAVWVPASPLILLGLCAYTGISYLASRLG